MDESGEWADNEAEPLSPHTAEHVAFYRRTRPGKDSNELTSPKKTVETLSKAKEQHHSPKKIENQVQEATLNRKRTSPTQPTSTRKSPPARQQEASTPQQRVHQQTTQRGLKDFPSKESLDREKRNGKEANPEIRRLTHELEEKGGGERTMSGHKQESFKRRVGGVSHRHRTSPPIIRQSDKGIRGDSGHKDANAKLKVAEDNNTSRDASIKRETMSAYKEMWKGKRSVVSPREAKGRDTSSYSKEDSKDLYLASIAGTPQSPKGPISPGPWKRPSSAKILSEAEVLRDPV